MSDCLGPPGPPPNSKCASYSLRIFGQCRGVNSWVLGVGAAAILSGSYQANAQASGANNNKCRQPASPSAAAAARIPRVQSPGDKRGEMLYRPLGSTGESVSVIGMGGSHLGLASVTEDEAIRLIHQALERGINFLDNSWDYNEGRSEMRVGKALSQAGYRQKAFVMTRSTDIQRSSRKPDRHVAKEAQG